MDDLLEQLANLVEEKNVDCGDDKPHIEVVYVDDERKERVDEETSSKKGDPHTKVHNDKFLCYFKENSIFSVEHNIKAKMRVGGFENFSQLFLILRDHLKMRKANDNKEENVADFLSTFPHFVLFVKMLLKEVYHREVKHSDISSIFEEYLDSLYLRFLKDGLGLSIDASDFKVLISSTTEIKDLTPIDIILPFRCPQTVSFSATSLRNALVHNFGWSKDKLVDTILNRKR